MKLLNKIFIISIILIPLLSVICLRISKIDDLKQGDILNIVYIVSFIITFILIIYDIIYVILFFVLKIGKGVDRLSLFERKDD